MEPTTGLRLGAMELPAPLWACLTDLLCASSYLGPPVIHRVPSKPLASASWRSIQ